MKLTLEQIREDALINVPQTLEICWDRMEGHPAAIAEFEQSLEQSVVGLQLLEYAYTTLILRGENIAIPGAPTSLKYEEIELLEARLITELMVGYQLQDVWQRYQAVKSL